MALFPMFVTLKVFLKFPYAIVLKVVSRSEKGPLSDSGVHFPRELLFSIVSAPIRENQLPNFRSQ